MVIEGSWGRRDWPRAGEITSLTTVRLAKRTTGSSTETTTPRRPCMKRGGWIFDSPDRPNRVNRRLFRTTSKLESPMAIAATSGSRSPNAARGRAETL